MYYFISITKKDGRLSVFEWNELAFYKKQFNSLTHQHLATLAIQNTGFSLKNTETKTNITSGYYEQIILWSTFSYLLK